MRHEDFRKVPHQADSVAVAKSESTLEVARKEKEGTWRKLAI